MAVGVSSAAVSATLSRKAAGRIRVSEETRAKIEKTASEMGYVPNMAAKSLKTGASGIIAVFTYENIFPVSSNNEFYGFFAGIQEEVEKLGYDLLILNNWSHAVNRAHRLRIADGALMIGLNRDDEHLSSLMASGYPLVSVGHRRLKGGAEPDYVTFDYRRSVEMTVGRLAPEPGARALYVKEPGPSGEPTAEKERWLKASLEERGVETIVIEASPEESCEEVIEAMRECGLVFFDRIAVADALAGFLGPGKRVRAAVLEDDWAGCGPPCVSWHGMRRELGALAARLLVSKLKGEPFREERLVLEPPVELAENRP